MTTHSCTEAGPGLIGMDLSSHPDMTAVATAARGDQLLQFCEAVFGSLPNWQRRMLLQLAAADEPFLVALHPPGRTGSTYVQRIMEETIVAIEERGSRPDQVTFKGRIRKVTDGGAYIITDGTITRPVPIGWVTLNPPKVQLQVLVDITMARRLAEEKGFATRAGKGQGSLL